MIRRDEIVKRLGDSNSTSVLEEQVNNLEKFIDDELQKDANILKWVNDSSIGASSTSGLERVLKANITNDVHRDITTNGENKVTIGTGPDAVAYVEWDEDITTADGNDATTEPWEDRTIAEGEFDGVLTIQCPATTNKNVAFLLAEKYMSIEFDDDGNPTGGFWSKAVKPNDKDNEVTTGEQLNDAVTVTYDKDTDTVFMNFKLF